MLSNFTLEPVKILASRLPFRQSGSVTKISKRKNNNNKKRIKPQRQRELERQEYPSKRGLRHLGATGSGANDLEEWRMMKSRWTVSRQ